MNDNLIINDKFDDNNIRFEVISTNIFMQTIMVYNGNTKIPNQKIWILIDDAKIININNNILTITLSSSNEIINIIEKIENKILNKVRTMTENNEITLKTRFINNKDYIIKFDIICDINTIFFDNYDKIIDNINYNINDNISIVCELSEMLFNNKFISIIWKTIQIKKKEKLDLTISLFKSIKQINIPDTQITRTENICEIKRPNFVPMLTELNNINLKKKEEIVIPLKKTAFVPTPDLLNQLKGGLRKTNHDNIKKLEETQIKEIPKLNHVVTKEHIPMVDILKREYDEIKLEDIYNFVIEKNKDLLKNQKKMKKLNKKYNKITKKLKK